MKKVRRVKNKKTKKEVRENKVIRWIKGTRKWDTFMYKHLVLSWKYLKNIKSYLWFSFLLFLVTILFGFFFPMFFQNEIKNLVSSLIEQTSGMNSVELILFIFFNNLKASFFPLVLGLILGIYPVLSLIINGYVLGFVASKTVSVVGISVLWKLFPHGIFEIPAVLISASLGLRLGMFLFIYKGKNKGREFMKWLKDSLRVFLFIVIPLLIIAAIIEGSLIVLLG
jgi:stage II sporulation protein M